MNERLLLATAAACFVCAALPGCGGEGSTGTTEAATEAVGRADRAVVPDQLSMEQAVAFAKAVNLRADDVPYFEERPVEPESEEDEERERRLKRDFGRCLGGIDLSAHMVYEESPAFLNSAGAEYLSVQSSVEVAPDAALARRRIDAYRTGRGKDCFRRTLTPLLEEEGSNEVEVGRTTVSRLSLKAPEIRGGILAYRVSTTATITGADSQLTAYGPRAEVATPRRSFPVFIDFLGFTVGPAEVSLFMNGAPAPVSENFERNLLSVLPERAIESLP
jgi:hypothetical protein